MGTLEILEFSGSFTNVFPRFPWFWNFGLRVVRIQKTQKNVEHIIKANAFHNLVATIVDNIAVTKRVAKFPRLLELTI